MTSAHGGSRWIECKIATTVQIVEIRRPLLLVTDDQEWGSVSFCETDEALVLDAHQSVLAVFKKKGGSYVANLKVRNTRNTDPFGQSAR